MRLKTCITARTAPEISQTAIAAPKVAQNSCLPVSTWRTVPSMTTKTACDTFGCRSGARSFDHTSCSDRKPSSPSANSSSGISANSTWNEIALA